jgi:hypothetical protein
MSDDADHPINPYAPSAVVEPHESLAALGAGCWRHGSLLVAHENAQLPPICVKTGKPAVEYRLSPIRWTHPLRWPAEYVQFAVPLSARPLFWLGPGRKWVLASAAMTIVISVVASLVAAVAIDREELTHGNPEASIIAVVLGIFVIFSCFAGWASLAQPLWIVRRKGKFYWLSGASRKFLEQIPNWPAL